MSGASQHSSNHATGTNGSTVSPLSEKELVHLIRDAFVAHIDREDAKKRALTEKVLTQFGLTPAGLVDHSPQQLSAIAKQKGGKYSAEILAGAISIVGVSAQSYQGNSRGDVAFALAERAVALNPFNPEILRLLQTALMKNLQQGPVNHTEKNREVITTISAFENYVTNGLGIREPYFTLPAQWKEKVTEWRHYGSYALENLASLKAARAVELRKGSEGLGPVIALQNESIAICNLALTVCGAPNSESEVSSLTGGEAAAGWKKIDSSQYARVERLFGTLAGIYEARKSEVLAYTRYHQAQIIAGRFSDAHTHLVVNNPSPELWLTRDPLGAKSPMFAEKWEEVPVVRTSPPAVKAPKEQPSIPPTQASFRRDRTSSPRQSTDDWLGYFESVRSRAEDRVEIATLNSLGSQVHAEKLPIDTLPETEVIAALTLASFWAAASGLSKPTETVAKLVSFSSTTMESAEETLELGSFLKLMATQATLRALNDRAGGGMGRTEKGSIQKQLAAMDGKIDELASTLDIERWLPKLKKLFSAVRVA